MPPTGIRYGLLVIDDSAELGRSSPEKASPPRGDRPRSSITLRSRSRRDAGLKAEEIDLPIDIPGLDSVRPGRLGSPIDGDAVLGLAGILPERALSSKDWSGGTAVCGRRIS